MDLPAPPSLFALLTGRRRRAARAPEPADLGTAFGMEQWLDEAEHLPPEPVGRPRRSWLKRWLQAGTGR